MVSHEFLYTWDISEKKRYVQGGQMKAVKLKILKEATVET
jgi:hypothetical protein